MNLWIWPHFSYLMLLLSPVGGAVPCKYTSCRRPDSQRFLYRRSCPRLGSGWPQVVCNAKPLFGQVIDFEDSYVVHAKSLLCVSIISIFYLPMDTALGSWTGFEASTEMNHVSMTRGIKEAIVHSSNPVQVEDAPSWKNPKNPYNDLAIRWSFQKKDGELVVFGLSLWGGCQKQIKIYSVQLSTQQLITTVATLYRYNTLRWMHIITI